MANIFMPVYLKIQIQCFRAFGLWIGVIHSPCHQRNRIFADQQLTFDPSIAVNYHF